MPSAQLPDPHSVPLVHDDPSGLLQVPVPLAEQVCPVGQVAVVQHTPSTQLPDLHWTGSLHAVPGSPLVVQVEVAVSQKYPAWQSEVLAHVVLQSVVPHL